MKTQLKQLTFILCLSLALACGDDGANSSTDTAETLATVLFPIGQTWSMNLASGSWIIPKNVSGIISLLAKDYPFYFGVHATNESTMDIILAIAAEGGGQDPCSRTITMTGLTIDENRMFQFGPTDYVLANGIVTHDLEMTGRLSEDFKSITEAEFKGNIVLSSIPADMLLLDEGVTACDLLETIESECNACRDGSNECLLSHAVGMTADGVTGIKLKEIDKADCHEACDVSSENPDCTL